MPGNADRKSNSPRRSDASLCAERSLPHCLADVSERSEVREGKALPLGVCAREGGVNFAFFSRAASRVLLELFDQPQDGTPSRSFDLDPAHNRTGDVWHIWIAGLQAGQLYGYRVDGPYSPREGQRFNVRKLLLDPCATAITSSTQWDFAPATGEMLNVDGSLESSRVDDAAAMPKCVLGPDNFDWQEDLSPNHSWTETVIYEAHVRGFTHHPSSRVKYPGTYRGLTEKIPYLTELGVTAVELMPVQEFNQHAITRVDPTSHRPLRDYWGYSPVNFFAPKGAYSSAGSGGQQTLEFKQMVRALHRAGMEVILDVVFNHTAEGDERGATLCFRGIDNAIFYMLEDDQRHYRDFTGTGNTVNANHPVVRDHILAALRYWVTEMHVDGFRFDLAAVLGRGREGELLRNPPLLARIAEDPILRGVKLIAEAWDAAGAYEVGSFAGRRWAEWNGRFRDDVRRFWRGDEGMLGVFAQRICGSADIYARSGKGPESSINFVACHDGFTLNDLVSYGQKHNEANGEGNRDGRTENFSDNCGAEGVTSDAAVNSIRQIQIKNMMLTLLISRGVPMLLGGDEARRTQGGNNNAYCQDNETSWMDWSSLERHAEVARFTRGMIAFRRAHPVLRQEQFYGDHDIEWWGVQAGAPHWDDAKSHVLACLIPEDEDNALCLLFNAGKSVARFCLSKGARWRLAIDTSRQSPGDLSSPTDEPDLGELANYDVAGRSCAILLGRKPPHGSWSAR